MDIRIEAVAVVAIILLFAFLCYIVVLIIAEVLATLFDLLSGNDRK